MTKPATGLTLVAGPIGNLGDLTERARIALAESPVWFVEDSRVSGKLAAHLGVRPRMIVVNEHARDARLEECLAEIEANPCVLVTDAGSPGISDPGAKLVDLCHEAGLPVDALPGPSAVTLSLTLSGFFAQQYAFLGFLGRKPGQIREALAPFQESTMTLVLFESPFRYRKLLEAVHDILGSRRFAICRELTKMHQQIWRGTLPDLPGQQQVPEKGEFTIVIEGWRRQATRREDEYND